MESHYRFKFIAQGKLKFVHFRSLLSFGKFDEWGNLDYTTSITTVSCNKLSREIGLGSEQQETKSLPRNRKCGNCRYFEPAPLWRKGWCRNPRLYDRRANHLVDAATIDCEQVFRARIYWEPVPSSEMAEFTGYGAPTGITGNPSADSGQADSGGMSRGKQPTDGILRPRTVISQNTPPNGI